LLLLAYDGYEPIDDCVNTLAGFCGLGICLFPCTPPESIGIVGTFQLPQDLSNCFHTMFAIVFFGLLAYNSLFLFTKTGSIEMTPLKNRRNIIFRVCGIGMIASFAAIFVMSLFGLSNAVWIGEALALSFFGISWLTKANCYKLLSSDC
jgi:prepilin signal peptidase PulO-like enzyme (type II secretory pathway)